MSTLGSGRLLSDLLADVPEKTPGAVDTAALNARFGHFFVVFEHAHLVGAGDNNNAIDDVTNPNLPMISAAPGLAADKWVVFAIQKRTATEFDFISVGRNIGNDLCVPHPSISRFHAYFRIVGGRLSLQDAKSSAGTRVNGREVNKQGQGDPTEVAVGDRIHFGAIPCRVVDAALLLEHASGMWA